MKGRQHRTIVYVDGFNFYYGAVRGTSWKWLDPVALFHKVLGPENKLKLIKYFTARVQPSPSDPDVNVRQDTYLRALQAHCPLVELYFGHFLRHPVRMEHVNPPPASVEVWKNEEKGSDVNLALHLLNDAWQNAYDCAVVVSNDSDLAEALRLVKAQNHKLIGLVTPGAPARKTSYQLRQHANFIKPIRKWMLEQSQLPDIIPGTTIRKPASW
ncbi:MAG: NYN domain-containing protein [Gammaproteobacteria bacterium]|nr:NYN domain-containing protein [Gammaproteobacteria bacterium]